MPLHFELPAHLTAEKFIAQLSKFANITVISQQYTLKTYYDSFDWRLYKKGFTFEFKRAKHESLLILKSLATGRQLAQMVSQQAPVFAKDFKPGKLHGQIESVLEIRALLAICTLDYEAYSISVLNKEEKTILRLDIEDYNLFNSRLTLLPIKGYDKALDHIRSLVMKKFELAMGYRPVLLDALALQGHKPQEYSSKLSINLAPDMRADVACKYIYSHLLQTIKVNEQGTIADLDSEFLHDFRIAVRRTRAGLNQLKGVLPETTHTQFTAFFSWLGQITNQTRDLDMYLVNFEAYKNSLPITIRNDLQPLYDFILSKQQKAQKELAKKLKSQRYLMTLSEWEAFLKETVQKKPLEANARMTIKELADLRIWKVYNTVIKEGSQIQADSSAEMLHSLRKTCKKLRYLMEFFQSLYPEQAMQGLIKCLKGLQDVLGKFQDCEVQEQTLKQFSEEMMAVKVQANTFLAMGVLIQIIDTHKLEARKGFNEKFADFQQLKIRKSFEMYFANVVVQL
ncbi:MAG: CHAD domain-containing protein [Methylococcaceae bacterium]|jgi:CHAD domain-containing protein